MFLRSTDPDGLFALFHGSLVGANFNWSCVKNPKLDAMLEQGRRESDPAKRRAIYVSIAQLAIEEALTVPLVDESALTTGRNGDLSRRPGRNGPANMRRCSRAAARWNTNALRMRTTRTSGLTSSNVSSARSR